MSISVSCMHLETAKENNRSTQVLLSAGIFRYFKVVKFIWGGFYSLIANYRFKTWDRKDDEQYKDNFQGTQYLWILTKFLKLLFPKINFFLLEQLHVYYYPKH